MFPTTFKPRETSIFTTSKASTCLTWLLVVIVSGETLDDTSESEKGSLLIFLKTIKHNLIVNMISAWVASLFDNEGDNSHDPTLLYSIIKLVLVFNVWI